MVHHNVLAIQKKNVGSKLSIFSKRHQILTKLLLTLIFLNPNKNLEKDYKYYVQIQCQLFVSNFEKCDFVVWTPTWLHITEIERDVQFMTNVLGTLQNFYIQNILLEVLNRKIENSAPKVFDGQKDKLYCFCNSPYQMKLGLVVTQKYLNCSGFIYHV